MDALDGFLNTYGVAAACIVLYGMGSFGLAQSAGINPKVTVNVPACAS